MAAIRSFVKIQPITGKSGIAQNMDQVRKSINRMGSVTDGIAKSFYDTTELLKFEKEYLSDTSKEEVTDIKKKDKKEKTKWTDSMRKFRRSFAKKKRERLEDQAEKGIEEGKEEGRKAIEKQKPKMTMLGKFLSGIFRVFKLLIVYAALDWLSNPQNAENAVKVFKVLFTIGKFAFKLTKMGVGMILDGLTNVFGNYSEEGAIRRGLRGVLGVVQLMGGLAVLRTAQYMIMPWKLLKDVNRLRMIFSGNAEQSAEAERNAQVRKGGYRDKKTGVIYSDKEYKSMQKAAARADRKNPGASKAFEERFGKEGRISKMRRAMGDKFKGVKGKFGGKANQVFGKLGGKLNVGMSVVGGAGRIAAGLASGEKASSAIGAGVGQGVGGLLGGIAGTALLGPFLGPFAPIVGNALGSFLGEWVGKELGPLMEPIFGPIKRYFGMVFEFWKMTLGPIIDQVKEPLGLIFQLIGRLGQFLMDGAKVLMDFTGFILGPVFNAIGGVVQFVVNNAKRLMNPASVAGGILDAVTFNLFDFDGENKKAAGGPVGMAAGGPMQFGSNADLLAATGGIYLKSIVGGLGAFGFVGNKVKSVLAPDIQKLGSAFGVSVGTGGGSAAGGVSTSVTFQATQTEKKRVENSKNLTYKKNIHSAIHNGLNKLLINGIKIFDPQAAAEIEKQRQQPGSSPGGPGGQTPNANVGSFSGNANSGSVQSKGVNIAKNFKSELGITKEAAAAIAGNFAHESAGFIPGIREGGPFGQNSKPWPKGTVGKGYGWAQWTNAAPGDRYDKFIESYGGDYSKVPSNEDNWKFAVQEMKGPEPLGSEFSKMTDVAEAAVWFRKYWERAGVHHDGPRIKYAKEFLAEMAMGGMVPRRSSRLGMGEPVLERYEELEEKTRKKKAIMGFAAGGLLATNGSVPDVRLTPDTPFSQYPLHHNKSDNHSYNNNRLGGHPILPRDYVIVRDWNDQSQDRGAPVVAGVDGKVVHASGYTVVIAKNGKDRMQFHHFDSIKATVGQMVQPSDIIGYQGNKPSGMVHVHLDATPSDHRSYAAHQLGADYDAESMSESDSVNGSSSANTGGGGDSSADTTSTDTPKTVEGMLAAFKTGIKSALEKLGTNVRANAPSGTSDTDAVDKAFADADFDSTPSIDAADITAVGSIRDDAVQKLKAIKEKAERDETGDIIPIVQERLVIQKVTQQINTSGSTKAVYTKPSPLLSQ